MHRQTGSALLISLVILVAITLAAVLSMQQSQAQLKMVGNFKHQQDLFEYTLGEAKSLENQLKQRNPDKLKLLDQAIDSGECHQLTGLCSGLYATGVDPFSDDGFTQPTPPTVFQPAQHRIIALKKGNSSLNEGNSEDTFVPFYFKDSIQTQDTHHQARNAQELGFYYLVPK